MKPINVHVSPADKEEMLNEIIAAQFQLIKTLQDSLGKLKGEHHLRYDPDIQRADASG